MKSTVKLLAALSIILSLACPALAQPAGGGRGPGRGMGPMIYNPQTVTTVKGQVESVGKLPPLRPQAPRENLPPRERQGQGKGMMYVGVVLKTDQGSLNVRLGPRWYLEKQGVVPKAGDTMEVMGSMVTVNQQPNLIAKAIQVNGQTLNLRDDQGIPLWRGMGMGRGRGPGR